MKLSTAKKRINKTLDELSQSVIDDWYANFKDGYIKGYADARQGISPMYAEAYEPADTPQTECDTCRHYKPACELFSEICKYEPTTQTETQNSNLTFEKQTDYPWK